MFSFFQKIFSEVLSANFNSNTNDFTNNHTNSHNNTNAVADKKNYNKNFISHDPINVIRLAKGTDVIDVKVRVSLKAKSLRIRITHKCAVELVLPKNINGNQLEDAYKFVYQKEEWIRSKLNYQRSHSNQNGDSDFLHSHLYHEQNPNSHPHSYPYTYINPNEEVLATRGIPRIVPIFAQDYLIVLYQPDASEHITISENRLLISHAIKEANIAEHIVLYLKQLVKGEIIYYAWKISRLLKVRYNKISIKDTKTRWGSCASNGNISFSWRLVFAPRYVMEYVVVHELCHILEMNHSHRFWKLVKDTCPGYLHAKEWLKKHGRSLHSYFA